MARVNDRRALAAEATRRAIVEAASRLFRERGYTGTTLAEIAGEAGVAIQTVYNSIGSKRDVLAKVLDYAASGEHAPTPPGAFAVAQGAEEPDVRKSLDQLVEFWREARARTAPFYEILRQAAALDPEAAEFERARAAERLASYRAGAQLLADRGALRAGLTIDDAAAVYFATGHPEVYRSLVVEGDWTPEHWARWIRSTLELVLLAPDDRPRRRRSERRTSS
jgi:AcrR family transcriptional regulator